MLKGSEPNEPPMLRIPSNSDMHGLQSDRNMKLNVSAILPDAKEDQNPKNRNRELTLVTIGLALPKFGHTQHPVEQSSVRSPHDHGNNDSMNQSFNRVGDHEHELQGTVKKSRTTTKAVLQMLFKSLRNLFTKEESNVPNEMLLRTQLIKKIVFYIVVVLVGMSTFYLIYEAIIQKLGNYDFAVQSMLMVTTYHNMTISVINELLHRDTIVYSALNSTAVFNPAAANTTADWNVTSDRLKYFKGLLLNLDIDNNVRSDFFFSETGQLRVQFNITYPNATTRFGTSSKYTIMMMMLEKLITIDNNEYYRQSAMLFLNDNFLTIVNQYFLDAFYDVYNTAADILVSNKVSLITITLENVHHIYGHLLCHANHILHLDIWNQFGHSAVHRCDPSSVSFHRRRDARKNCFILSKTAEMFARAQQVNSSLTSKEFKENTPNTFQNHPTMETTFLEEPKKPRKCPLKTRTTPSAE